MRTLRNTHIFYMFVISIIVVSNIAVYWYVSQIGNPKFVQQAPSYVKGWYDAEYSTTLPTSRGVIATEYRWTYDEATLRIWPAPMGMRLFELTYINPFGDVWVAQNQQVIASLPRSEHLRTAYILFPSSSGFDVTFEQTQPQRIDQRALGFIVLRFDWHVYNALMADPSQFISLLIGLPLTTLLTGLLCTYAGIGLRNSTLISLSPVCVTALIAQWSPWHSIAMQPMVQFILIAGICGLFFSACVRRVRFGQIESWLLILWIVSSILLFTPDVQGDGVGYYAYLRSVFIDGDLQFANEFNKSLSPFAFVPIYPIYAPTGYTINPWSIGPAILQVPFWLFAHSIVLATNLIGITNWAVNGYVAPYVTMVGLSSVVAGLVTLFGMYHILRRYFTPPVAVLSVAFMYLASNLLYYAQVNNNNVHSISTATVTLMIIAFLATQDRPTWRRWIIFGISVGVIGIVYWVTLILCLFPAGVICSQAWMYWREHNRSALRQLIIGVSLAALSAVLILGLQSVTWYVMYESLFTVPQGNAFALPQYPRLWQVFFGDWYGLFWWTPAIFIGILGLFLYARSAPTYGTWMVVAVWAYILYNASIPNWDGSSGFGFRRLASMAPLIVFGIAHIVERTAQYRQLQSIVFGVYCAWTTRFLFRYVEFRIVRSSKIFLDDLVIATFDPAIINITTLVTVLRPTWLGKLWRSMNVEQLIVTLMVIIIIAGISRLWYHPIAVQWWGISTSPKPTHEEQS